MIEKYRVHEVAKDLGIPSKDLIALLEANFPDRAHDRSHRCGAEPGVR